MLDVAAYSVTAQLAADQRRNRQLIIAAVFVSAILAWLVLRFEAAIAVAVIAGLVLLAVAWQARIGLMVAVGLLILFEPLSSDDLMLPGFYLNSSLNATLGVPISISPIEILLLLTF